MFIYGNFQRLPKGDYDLPQLELLHLYSEDLTEIPEGNHFLPSLTAFYIPRCELESIPSSFFAGEKLEELNVGSTQLHQLPKDLSNCQKLHHLTITAPLTEGIPNLINTSIQNISLNKLEGPDYKKCQLPKTVSRATFSGQTIVNFFPDLSKCENLLTLTLRNSQNYPYLSGTLSSLNTLSCINIAAKELPKELDTATNLTSIFISKCSIENFPLFILNCAFLTYLQLDHVKIKSIPEDWRSCTNLETLVITSDALKVQSLDFAQNFKKLKTFDLSQTMRPNLGAGIRAILGGNNHVRDLVINKLRRLTEDIFCLRNLKKSLIVLLLKDFFNFLNGK
ncbi:MAG: erbb2-interacting protein [Saprospiraceae bacterium]|jgi:erbb2-interacting protein